MGDSASVNPQLWGAWNGDVEKRPNNYLLKRPHQTGRPGDAAISIGNAAQRESGQHGVGINGNGHHHVVGLKSRGSLGSRAGSGERGNAASGKSGRSNLYRLLILVVALFFLIEFFAHGVVFLLFRSADLQDESLELFFRASGSEQGVSGGDVRFVPRKIVERLLLSRGRATVAELRNELRSPVRPPRLALVCPNLEVSALSLYELTVAKGLKELGYNLEVYTLKDGELRPTWEALGMRVKQLRISNWNETTVDWLNYEGIVAVSLNTKAVLNSLAQEPFIHIPVIWVITDDALGRRLGEYESAAAKGLILDWRLSFGRADVVIFPDYSLPMIYTMLDTGNFFVIPGSPAEVWTAEHYKLTHSQQVLRAQYGLQPDDLSVAVVGSPFLYHGLWREHALVMRAMARALSFLGDASAKVARRVHLFIVGHGNQSSNYGVALQVMAMHLGLEKGTVHYVGAGEDVTGVLWMSDAVVYASFRDEQAFPPLLTRAMSLQRPVIAPNRSVFREEILDGETGVMFPVGDHIKLSEGIVGVLRNKTKSLITVTGQSKARNLLAANMTLSFGELLESILEFPVEAELPKALSEANLTARGGWCWDVLFPAGVTFRDYFLSQPEAPLVDRDLVGSGIVDDLEDQWMVRATDQVRSAGSGQDAEFLSDFDLDEAKAVEEDLELERLEQEELDERKAQVHTTWEDVTKMVRKTEVHKDDLKERSDAELQRTGQPLCIYESYHGKGAWPFLHDANTLYRGVSLSSRGRRPGDDDVDAQERLPGLLNDSYYRNVLCEYGAFFAIANRIDFVHKNAWIGFQPWRASSRNVALTAQAEASLIEAVRTGRHGDAIFFWARTDGHAGISSQGSTKKQAEDFWAYCDSINSGQCREAFAGTLRRMYGLPANWTSVPPMPADGGTWAAMHCWVMPTPSFVELVLFARMFVDALDAEYYEEHHDRGKCYFVRFQREGQHCYCRLLEGIVNVWAYHSARRMIYVDPQTGIMEEQHPLGSRRGKMWVKFFHRSTLKAMDEDLAEAADDGDHPRQRWLWPQTGEVYWQGIYERERRERWRLKLKKKQMQKEKLFRMRNRTKQKALGKYIKPPPGFGYLNPLDKPEDTLLDKPEY